MKERVLTCIICPKGCKITVKSDENGISGINRSELRYTDYSRRSGGKHG